MLGNVVTLVPGDFAVDMAKVYDINVSYRKIQSDTTNILYVNTNVNTNSLSILIEGLQFYITYLKHKHQIFFK